MCFSGTPYYAFYIVPSSERRGLSEQSIQV